MTSPLLEPTAFIGCYDVRLYTVRDSRGSFAKYYQEAAYTSSGVKFEIKEQFFSTSTHRVLRGMHFQIPPAHQAKLVTCIAGAITDVALDLRKDSPTFRQCLVRYLDASLPLAVLLAPGMAHGFLVTSAEATVHYAVTRPYSPMCDGGIRWDSIPFGWPDSSPIVSHRDQALPRLDEFNSPFLLSV